MRPKTKSLILLTILVLTVTLVGLPIETFEQGGEQVCSLAPNGHECHFKLHETDETLGLDQKCRPAAEAYRAVGMFQRSGNQIIDNGRLRRSPYGDDAACALLLSDDLVQDPTTEKNIPLCSLQNPQLFRQGSFHQDVVSDISKNAELCEIRFKESVQDEKMVRYVEDLRQQANRIVEKRARRF